MRPEVIYGSWPPVTTIRLGGRTLESDVAVPVKIKLLEPEEDQKFWICKEQHESRINLGDFHRDFGDVEVAYSSTFPRTHVTFLDIQYISRNSKIFRVTLIMQQCVLDLK